MPFVTTIRLRSGDRAALDDLVEEVRRTAERKGVELRGPHTSTPRSHRVPLYRRLAATGGRFPPWDYTVYERVVELTGHDETVRSIVGKEPPRGVHVEVSVDQVRSVGSG